MSITLATGDVQEPVHPHPDPEVDSSDDSDDGEDSSDDSDSDDGEDIAKKLGDQLWAEINKAKADRAHGEAAPAPAVPVHSQAQAQVQQSRLPPVTKEEVLGTIRQVLTSLDKDPGAFSVFSSTHLDGQSLVSVLTRALLSATITKQLARQLHPLVLALANSEALFSSKRKREDEEDRISKRPRQSGDFHDQIASAVHAISTNLTPSGLNPSIISSLQLQLHQIFLFSVTASSRQGPYAHILQEISGLIQVIGVLSGISIGTNTFQSSTVDIGAAVYPCLLPGCSKTFERLYHLRSHQRCHSDQRPHRCTVCPAAFARSHDLKRHAKLHDRKAFKCGSCTKIFSRRDAIKRHMNRTGATCEGAEISEVDLDGEDDPVRDERLTKIWSNGHEQLPSDLESEEGELDPERLVQSQTVVMSIHNLLKSLVGNTSDTTSVPQGLDPSYGQAALANVIARAQSTATATSTTEAAPPSTGSLSVSTSDGQVFNPYGLSDEQARILEQAIVNAAAAAQAQAEAEAAMEEDEKSDEEDDELDDEENEGS